MAVDTVGRVAEDPDRGRVLAYAAVAVGLAVTGVAVNVWRPLAPPLAPVATDLANFLPEVVDAVRDYQRPRQGVAVAVHVLHVAVLLLAVVTAAGRRAVAWLAGGRGHAPLRGGLLAAVLVAAADLATLPLVWRFGYLHDLRHGFATATPLGWLRDWALANAYGWLLAAAAAAAVLAGARRWPTSWPWRVTIAGTAAAGAVVVAAPLLFEPLWLPTRPLPPGPSRAAVEDVLAAAGEASTPILVGEASRRTTVPNAYVSGLGPSRRIVVYDTMLDVPAEHLAAVVAHEVAHRRHGDLPRGVLLSAAGILPAALAADRVRRSRRLHAVLGLRGPTDPRLVAPLAVILAAGSAASLPVASLVSRRAEAAADHAALELTADPATAVRLHRAFVVRDLADPHPPGWYRLVASHPPAARRITAAVSYARAHRLPLPSLDEVRGEEAALRHPRARAGE